LSPNMRSTMLTLSFVFTPILFFNWHIVF
jgi:hypothetical protein